MAQELTIVYDGKGGQVDPQSTATILRAVFSLLEVLDEKGWNVGTPRVKWRLSEAKLVNPLTVTAAAIPLNDYQRNIPDFGAELVRAFEQIEQGQLPYRIDKAELQYVRDLGREGGEARSLSIIAGSNGTSRRFEVTKTLASRATQLIQRRPRVRHEYSSLEGTVVQLNNDPLKDDGHARLRDRFTGVDVVCVAEPAIAAKMAQYMNRTTRLVVFGRVRFADDVATHIDVEEFSPVPTDEELPSLDDLHVVGFGPPEGQTVEDFLDELRGDE